MTNSATATMVPETISELRFSDVTGQKVVRATSVPADSTIAELMSDILAKLGLSRSDSKGRSLTYRARLERKGEYLPGGSVVGDTLQPGDDVVLAPSIDAGRD